MLGFGISRSVPRVDCQGGGDYYYSYLLYTPLSTLLTFSLELNIYILTKKKHTGGRHDASPAALKLNPNSEQLFIDSTLTARCYENTCAIIFANAAGPADSYLGMSRAVLPFMGPVQGKSMSAEEEGHMVVDLDMSVLDLAEENYKVRQDLRSEGWHYTYRHDQYVDKRPAESGN